MKHSQNIDEYILAFPKEVQVKLQKIRAVIAKAAPLATEAISYGIPTFKLNGNLVHFGGFKDHISFFPTGEGVEVFKKELEEYDVSKGTIRFPLDKPIPFDLVKKIVEYRVMTNLRKQK